MKKYLPFICALFVILSLTLIPTHKASALDLDVGESQRFYYSTQCSEMSGTLSAIRNGNPSPEHWVYGEVANTNISIVIDAELYDQYTSVSINQTDTPTTGRYYLARCYETVYVSRYGFYNINFNVLAEI